MSDRPDLPEVVRDGEAPILPTIPTQERPPRPLPKDDTKGLLAATQAVLVFADGVCLSNTGMVLADLYAEDYAPAQEALRAAGCWPRGSFRDAKGDQ